MATQPGLPIPGRLESQPVPEQNIPVTPETPPVQGAEGPTPNTSNEQGIVPAQNNGAELGRSEKELRETLSSGAPSAELPTIELPSREESEAQRADALERAHDYLAAEELMITGNVTERPE